MGRSDPGRGIDAEPLRLPPRSARRKSVRAKPGGPGRLVLAAGGWGGLARILAPAVALAATLVAAVVPALDCCLPAAGVTLPHWLRDALPWAGAWPVVLGWAGAFARLTGRAPIAAIVAAGLSAATAGAWNSPAAVLSAWLQPALDALAGTPPLGLYYGGLALGASGPVVASALGRTGFAFGLRAARADAAAAASVGVPVVRLRLTALLLTLVPTMLGGAALGLLAPAWPR